MVEGRGTIRLVVVDTFINGIADTNALRQCHALLILGAAKMFEWLDQNAEDKSGTSSGWRSPG